MTDEDEIALSAIKNKQNWARKGKGRVKKITVRHINSTCSGSVVAAVRIHSGLYLCRAIFRMTLQARTFPSNGTVWLQQWNLHEAMMWNSGGGGANIRHARKMMHFRAATAKAPAEALGEASAEVPPGEAPAEAPPGEAKAKAKADEEVLVETVVDVGICKRRDISQ
eukprot:gene850-4122_t